MGLTQLQDFRLRLQAALGNANYDNALLDVWINAGIQEVAGAVVFDALEERVDFPILDGTYRYAAPIDLIRPISLAWPTGAAWLLKTSKSRLDHLQRATEDTPKLWAYEHGEIVVWPTPAANATLTLLYCKEHPLLVDDTETTLLPATWDNACYYFAVSAAMLDLGDDERATFWHNKGIQYAGSRLTDAEFGTEAVTEPVKVVTKGEELYRQQPR